MAGNLPYEKEFADLVKTVSDLTAKIELLNQEFNKTVDSAKKMQSVRPTTLKETSQATKNLTNNTKQLVKIEGQSIKTKQDLKIALRDANKLARQQAEIDRLRTRSGQKLNQQLKQQNQELKKLRGTSNGLVSSLKSTALAFVGIYQAIRLIGNTTKIVVQFQKENSKLASILGKTRKETKGLSEDAIKYGKSTAFAANEVTKLQVELAKLGFTEKQIKASTKGILDLAAATGTELAEAATLAGSTRRGFELDANEMGRVTDILSASTSMSALDMEKLATAMPIVSATAKTAGDSIELTTAKLGTLSNAGLDASQSATALRNIYLELAKRGLTWDEAMAKIENSTNKNAMSMELFGKRGATAAIILQENEENTNKLDIALKKAGGTAQRMAEEQLNNLAGEMTITKSKWEGFVLSLENGDGVLSTVGRSIIKFIGGFFEMGTKINENTKYIGDGFKLLQRDIKKTFNELLPDSMKMAVDGIENYADAILNADSRINVFREAVEGQTLGTEKYFMALDNLRLQLKKVYGDEGQEIFKQYLISQNELFKDQGKLEEQTITNTKAEEDLLSVREEQSQKLKELLKLVSEYYDMGTQKVKVYSDELEKLPETLEELKEVQEATFNTDEFSWFEKFTAKIAKFKTENEELISAFKQFGSAVADFATQELDARIEQLDREIEIQNQRISELQASIENEADLKREGYANDYDLEKDQLKKLQAERDKDVKRQEKIAKQKEIIDTAVQVSNIITAVSEILEAFSVVLTPAGALLLAGTLVAGFATLKEKVRKLAVGEVDIKGGERGKDSIPSLLMPGETVHTVSDTQRALNFHHALHEGASNEELFTALQKDVGLPGYIGLDKEIAITNNFDDRLYKQTLITNGYLAQLASKEENENRWESNDSIHIKRGNKEIIIKK